jgi:hypothetical protein
MNAYTDTILNEVDQHQPYAAPAPVTNNYNLQDEVAQLRTQIEWVKAALALSWIGMVVILAIPYFVKPEPPAAVPQSAPAPAFQVSPAIQTN